MAKRKQRELEQKRTTSKRGKTHTKINSAPKKSAKRTSGFIGGFGQLSRQLGRLRSGTFPGPLALHAV
jgi:hypothetical protein